MGQQEGSMRWVVLPLRGDWGRCQVGRLADLQQAGRGREVRPAMGGLVFDLDEGRRIVDDLNLYGWASVE